MVKINPRIFFLVVSLFFIIPINLRIDASNDNSKIDMNKTLAFIPGTDKLPDSYIWTQNSSPCSAGEAYCYQDTTGKYQHGIESTQNYDLPPAGQSVNDSSPNGNTSPKSEYGGSCTIFGGCVNEGVCELTDSGGINGQCVAPSATQPTSCSSQSGRAIGCSCEQSNNNQCASQYCGGPYRVEDIYRRGNPKTIGTCQISPTPSPSVTVAPARSCPGGTANSNTQLKDKGDANCSGTITIQDFNLWRDEFIAKEGNTQGRTKYADFNGGDVTISDYNRWRDSFIAVTNGTTIP